MRKRPIRHRRRIMTKRGRKTVLVNKNIIRKKQPKKLGTIGKNTRRVFTLMSSSSLFDREFGGNIDLGKKGTVENFTVTPGQKYDVDFPDDYELQYHTHPSSHVDPPSPEDVFVLIHNKNQQAELVFVNGITWFIGKTPASKALSKLPAAHLLQVLDRAYSSTKGPDWESNYKKELEKLGFHVEINRKPSEALRLKVKPIEPKKNAKGGRWV